MTAAQITRDKMFELILAADPSFRPRWTDFTEEWGDEVDAPRYLAIGSLAEHILECLYAGRTARFGMVFAVIEQWHTDGDAYVSEAASVGLLESLQNLSGGSDKKTMTVERWLGPESRRWWHKLDRFWEGDRNALSSRN